LLSSRKSVFFLSHMDPGGFVMSFLCYSQTWKLSCCSLAQVKFKPWGYVCSCCQASMLVLSSRAFACRSWPQVMSIKVYCEILSAGLWFLE
jgi:hypothetical protein